MGRSARRTKRIKIGRNRDIPRQKEYEREEKELRQTPGGKQIERYRQHCQLSTFFSQLRTTCLAQVTHQPLGEGVLKS